MLIYKCLRVSKWTYSGTRSSTAWYLCTETHCMVGDLKILSDTKADHIEKM